MTITVVKINDFLNQEDNNLTFQFQLLNIIVQTPIGLTHAVDIVFEESCVLKF